MATPGRSPPPPATTVSSTGHQSDLQRLRRELARARRSLAQVREDLNNVIDDGSDDNSQVLDDLQGRESAALTRISEIETNIAEAQATIDAERSDLARQAGLSRAIQARLSVEDQNTTSSPPNDREGVLESPQYVSFTPSRAGNVIDPVPRVDERPPTTLADLNRLPVPEVQSGPHVASHVSLVENLFVEAGAGQFSASGSFVPHAKFKLTCFTKLATSLKPCPAALAVAHEVARTTRYDWASIRHELWQQFSRKDQLRDEYRSALQSLKFGGLEHADDFLRKCSALYHLYQDVYKDEASERRVMVRAVVNKLPENLRLDVIESVHHSTGVSRDTECTTSEDLEWELLLPFDGVRVGPTVVRCIRKSCRVFRDASIKLTLQSSSAKASEKEAARTTLHTRAAIDTLSQLHDGNPKHKRENLSKWASKFAAVYVIGGPGVQGPSDKVVRSDESKTISLRSGKGQLWFVAYNNKTEGLNAVKEIENRSAEDICETILRVDHSDDYAGVSHDLDLVEDVPLSTFDSLLFVKSKRHPPEIIIRGKVTSPSDVRSTLPTPVFIDSGAGLSYLLLSDSSDLCCGPGSPFEECEADLSSVRLADGSRREVSAVVETILGLFPHDCADPLVLGEVRIRLRVLVVKSFWRGSSTWCVLAGRNLLSYWQLEIRGSSYAAVRGVCVYQNAVRDPSYPSSDDLSILQVLPEGCEPPDLNLPGVRVQPSCDDSVDLGFPIPLGTKTISRVMDVLNALCDEGWAPLLKCPGDRLSVRLRKLLPVEVRDTLQQRYTFEIKFAGFESDSVRETRSCAGALYDRLSAENRKAYFDLIEDYVKRFWWVRAPPVVPTISSMSPVIPVFMVGPSMNRKPRLVLDCRELNRGLPKASSEAPDAFVVIGCLRWQSPPVMATVDAKQAFYRVRLQNLILQLGAATSTYWSSRMCFGLVFGPCGLLSSFGKLVAAISCLFMVCLWSLFVDDFVIGGSSDAVINNVKVLLFAMFACGFGVQLAKLRFICCASVSDAMTRLLSSLGVPISEKLPVLGVNFYYIDDNLILSCDRSSRLRSVRDFVVSDTSFETSKSEIYSICGKIGFDPAKRHPDCRAAADAMRALIGKAFNKEPWSERINLVTSMTTAQFAVFTALLMWMRELTDNCDCSHTSPCSSSSEPISALTLACDASRSGGGFLIVSSTEGGGDKSDDFDISSSPVICSEAFRWSKRQRLYHSNRRELMTLLLGLRTLSKLVAHQVEHCVCREPLSISVRSDNRACIAWSAQDASSLFTRSKAVEKRAIGRLILAIADEIKFLRRHASVSVLHVKGSPNLEADRLSRLFDRPCGNGLSLADALAGDIESGEIFWPTDDDEETKDLLCILIDDFARSALDRSRLFSELESENVASDLGADLIALLPSEASSSSFADQISHQCYDLSQAFHAVKALRFILRVLKANCKGREALEELEYPSLPNDRDIRALVHSAQQSDDICSRLIRESPTPSGPYVQDNDLVVFRSGTPFGFELRQFVIPKSSVALREKILLEAHRRCGHQGLRPSLSYVEDFHLPSGTSQMRDLLRLCVVCRTLRARRYWNALPSVRTDVVKLNTKCPYYKVAIDYYAVGDKIKLLSAMCCFSKHISFFRVESETSEEALRVLKILQLRTGGVRIIRSDRASYFRSVTNFVDRAATLLNASVELTSSRSPWELGSEKLHDIAGDRLRVLLRSSAGRWPDDSVREQQLLEELMLLMNTRPLGTYYVSENGSDVITPDALCYGRTRRLGCLYSGSTMDDAEFATNFAPYRVRAFRNAFVSWLWSELKKHSCSSVRAKSRGVTPAEFAPGDAVLVYMGGRKLGMSFRLGHVIELVSGRRVRVRFPSGLITLENLYNIVLLRAHSHISPEQSNVSRVGMPIVLGSGSCEREAQICFDPCNYSGEVWVKLKNGNVPEIVDLSSAVWRLGSLSSTDSVRQGGRDSTRDNCDTTLPSLVGMRLSVLYDVIIPGRKRPQKRYYRGTVVAVRASGDVDIEWDDIHSEISTLDLSSATYHIVR